MEALNTLAEHAIDHAALGVMSAAQLDGRFLKLDASNGPVTESLVFNKGLVINESGGDFDTRIEGDTDVNTFFVDASTDRVGIGTNTPAEKLSVTGNLTVSGSTIIPSGGNLRLYNTADQVTNYERGIFSFNSNVLSFMVDAGGSGTVRNFRVGTNQATTNDTYMEFSAGGSPKFNFVKVSGTGLNVAAMSATMTSSSAVQEFFAFNPTVNQSSTGGFRFLKINMTQTAVGSGIKRFIDLQVGANSQIYFDYLGAAVFNEQGNDADFRIEGDTDANNIFSDASTDRVGIGTATPANKLEVNGTVQADGLRLDLTPTAESVVPTHTFVVSINGTDYKVPIVAA